MTKKITGKAAIASAIGSAAIAAAMLYANKRKERKNQPQRPGPIPVSYTHLTLPTILRV